MKHLLLLLFPLTYALSSVGQSLFPSERLEAARLAYRAQDPQALAAVEALQTQAEAYLTMTPCYVAEKQITPPSGDKRDYMTLSPYWWPDPEQADGLPYIRRDGERNPEVYQYPERENSNRLGEASRSLALLYYVTGEERYAAQCAALIRAWFLDEERGMNPHMNFAQGIPGRVSGRGAVVIDARRFSYALAVVPLIRPSKHWSKGDDQALKRWSQEFLRWMEESEIGRQELRAANNHGLWYDAIRLMNLALQGDRKAMQRVVRESLLPRLDRQLAEDGSLPKELERTLALHYSTFALEAVALCGVLVEECASEIWGYRTADGRSLEAAVAYLEPYYRNPEQWPHRQIKPFDPERGAQILYLAGSALGRADWIEHSRTIGCQPQEVGWSTVLYYEQWNQ